MTLLSCNNIISGFSRKGIIIDKESAEQVAVFMGELFKWNAHITLISEGDKQHILDRHVINSIALYRHIDRKSFINIADIGSGNGFPGIMLAIMYKNKQFTLIENRGKKASFLKQSIQVCGIENAYVFDSNAKKFDYSATDLIISRAFGSISFVRSHINTPFNGHTAIYQNNDILLYDKYDKQCST